MSLIVYEHPLSPYAQKVKISLDEKGVPYETRMPAAIGSGQPDTAFLKSNPRYAQALRQTDEGSFAQALQGAGYATDPDYARKIGDIAGSARMQLALANSGSMLA